MYIRILYALIEGVVQPRDSNRLLANALRRVFAQRPPSMIRVKFGRKIIVYFIYITAAPPMTDSPDEVTARLYYRTYTDYSACSKLAQMQTGRV